MKPFLNKSLQSFLQGLSRRNGKQEDVKVDLASQEPAPEIKALQKITYEKIGSLFPRGAEQAPPAPPPKGKKSRELLEEAKQKVEKEKGELAPREEELRGKREELVQQLQPRQVEAPFYWRSLLAGAAVAALARLLGANRDDVEEALMGYVQGLAQGQQQDYQAALLAEEERQKWVGAQLGLTESDLENIRRRLEGLDRSEKALLSAEINLEETEAERDARDTARFWEIYFKYYYPRLLSAMTPEEIEVIENELDSIPEMRDRLGLKRLTPSQVQAILDANRANAKWQVGLKLPDMMAEARKTYKETGSIDMALIPLKPLFDLYPEVAEPVVTQLRMDWVNDRIKEAQVKTQPILRDAVNRLANSVIVWDAEGNARGIRFPGLQEMVQYAQNVKDNVWRYIEGELRAKGLDERDISEAKGLIEDWIDAYFSTVTGEFTTDFVLRNGSLAVSIGRYYEYLQNNEWMRNWRQANLDLDKREQAFNEFAKSASLELSALKGRRTALNNLIASYEKERNILERQLKEEKNENNRKILQQALLNVVNVLNNLRENLRYLEALMARVEQDIAQRAPAQRQVQTGQAGGGQVINFGKPPGKVLSGG